MNNDPNSTPSALFPLPEGIKARTYKVGSNLTSPLIPVPAPTAQGSASRAPFEVRLQDPKLQLTVSMRESETGRLIADVFSAEMGLLNKAWVSVSLWGTAEGQQIRKSVPLDVAQTNGCSGSADFGPLANAVEQLGDRLGLIVFLVLR